MNANCEPCILSVTDDESMVPRPCHDNEEEAQKSQGRRSKYESLPSSSSRSAINRLQCTDHIPSFMTPVVLSILITETAERFSYYGFRAILVLYFVMELHYSEITAIALFAYMSGLAYCTPILGAVIADVYLGRYNTILLFGIIYGLGLILLTFAAFLPDQYNDEKGEDETANITGNQWKRRICTFVALFFVCVGTGGIKPCVSAFGADQVSKDTAAPTVVVDYQDGGEIERGGLEKDCKMVVDEGKQTSYSVDPLEPSSPVPPLAQQSNPQTENLTRLSPEAMLGQTNGISKEGGSDSREDKNIRSFFAFFYFCNNVGAVTSIFLVPIIRGHFSFGAAFLAPTLFHIVAFVIFISKRKEYKMHKPEEGGEGESLLTTFKVFFVLIGIRLESCIGNATSRTQMSRVCNGHNSAAAYRPHADAYDSDDDSHSGWDDHSSALVDDTSAEGRQCVSKDTIDPTEKTDDMAASPVPELMSFSRQQIDDAAQVVHILPILALIPVFWTLYDQQASVWTLQATRMNLHGLQPEQLNVVNPVEIMFFVPIFDRCIYPALEARGWSVGHLDRMGWGMVMTAVSFVVSGLLENAIQSRQSHDGDMIHVLWQLPQITIMAVGEILVSVTGLEFAYSNAPERMKALIMALYLLTTATGDFLGGVLYSSLFRDMNRATAMYVCAGIMLVNLCVFCWVASWWEHSNDVNTDPNTEAPACVPRLGDNMDETMLDHPEEEIVEAPKESVFDKCTIVASVAVRNTCETDDGLHRYQGVEMTTIS